MRFLNEMYVRLNSVRDESGQGMAEYGLILALIAVVCIAGFTAVGTGVLGTVQGVSGSL